jgi:hypothetical protein
VTDRQRSEWGVTGPTMRLPVGPRTDPDPPQVVRRPRESMPEPGNLRSSTGKGACTLFLMGQNFRLVLHLWVSDAFPALPRLL